MRKRLRRPLIPAIVALLALGVWAEIWYSRQPGQTNDPVSNGTSMVLENGPSGSVTITPTPLRTARPVSPSPAVFAPPDQEAMIELDKVGEMLRDYRTLAGENPVGTNAEIMAALMGGNQKQATLGPPEGMKLNEQGELLDRWGTPYFFHQISRDHMEIRSAGPDKILWNEDDPTTR